MGQAAIMCLWRFQSNLHTKHNSETLTKLLVTEASSLKENAGAIFVRHLGNMPSHFSRWRHRWEGMLAVWTVVLLFLTIVSGSLIRNVYSTPS